MIELIQLFDSHCHLDDPTYANDFERVMARARQAGVAQMMTIGVNLDTSRKAAALARVHAGVLFASVGVHPHDASGCSERVLKELIGLAQRPEVHAWGEIGLDFNRMYSAREVQEKWFLRQIEVAADLELPLIFHERDSGGRFLELLQACPPRPGRAVVHCFSGSRDELERYLEMGYFIGITGIVTLKERGEALRRLVPLIPAGQLVVETDAPYLTPEPDRKKLRRNEPACVRSVLLKLAEVRREDPEQLAPVVFANTCRLYAIDDTSRGPAAPGDNY
jgi:TatD DNase family protein